MAPEVVAVDTEEEEVVSAVAVVDTVEAAAAMEAAATIAVPVPAIGKIAATEVQTGRTTALMPAVPGVAAVGVTLTRVADAGCKPWSETPLLQLKRGFPEHLGSCIPIACPV